MPRFVDRDERRALIIRAVHRLITERGIEAASLRNVAAESELNIGSVRYYFPSHTELLLAAAEAMVQRVTTRIERHAEVFLQGPANPREAAVDLLEEFLPIDQERRDETILWLTFAETSRRIPELRPMTKTMIAGPRQLAHGMLQHAQLSTPTARAEALAALIDGLALAMLHDPEHYTRRRARATLRWQLEAVMSAAQ
ncbi:TetR/AcrR family transcriptional regulator [Microlunatus speluncae]|uniref:TetR/AcrR family transcriptional regulator n=1 Tax=Microlunatus speluncae TaxID=2594267 RepID=UPI001266352F|nr:TetR/AcrR family transcriptional regulator [Microlunatus speluncae]